MEMGEENQRNPIRLGMDRLNQLEKDTREFLTKDNERYNLERMGFFSDIRKEARLLASKFPPEEGESFSKWKSRCLREYYRLKGFSIFCREHMENPVFESTVKALTGSHLKNLAETSERTDADRFLAPDNDTVSYAMPAWLFQELFTFCFSSMPSFGNPSELDTFCRRMAADNFPVEEPRIIGCMQDNSQFYWEKFYRKLRPITDALCYQMSGVTGENNTHDIWSDTCISTNRAVVERKLKEPVNAKAIISYSVGTLKNKNRELARNKARTAVDVDSIQYRLTDEDDKLYFNNPVTDPKNFPSQISSLDSYIDFTDRDSVQGYFIVVLYNREHPLHDTLVKGYEDKIERMFEHYIDGLSYEEIVTRHYGITDPKSVAKECTRLRQEMKRLKKSLTDRFDDMLKEYR